MRKNFNEVINNLKCEIMNSIDVEFAKYNKEKNIFEHSNI